MTKELQKVWIDGNGRRRETIMHKQTVTIEFSQQLDPNSWSGKTGRSIWVGHPAIARWIIRCLKWFSERRNEQR